MLWYITTTDTNILHRNLHIGKLHLFCPNVPGLPFFIQANWQERQKKNGITRVQCQRLSAQIQRTAGTRRDNVYRVCRQSSVCLYNRKYSHASSSINARRCISLSISGGIHATNSAAMIQIHGELGLGDDPTHKHDNTEFVRQYWDNSQIEALLWNDMSYRAWWVRQVGPYLQFKLRLYLTCGHSYWKLI